MLFGTHIFIGLLVYLIVILTAATGFSLSNLFVFFLGVVAPDLDHSKSKVGRKVLPLSWSLNKIFGHRGLTHSLVGALMFSVIFGYVVTLANFSISLSYWFFAGFIAHLLGDSLTLRGIKWFYPLSNKRVKGFVRTGSFTETIILALVITALFYVGKQLLI